MKFIYPFIIFFIITPFSFGQAKEQLETNGFYLKLEILKPLSFIDQGYIIEPEFSWQHKKMNYNISVGVSKIENNNIYKEMEYINTGRYILLGVQYQLVMLKKRFAEGLFVGMHINFTDFKETGKVTFDGDYFSDYEARLKQNNTLAGIGYLASFKFHVSQKIMFDATGRISTVISQYNQPEFPVYYVPGSGIINIFENREQNTRLTAGFSVKIGYKF